MSKTIYVDREQVEENKPDWLKAISRDHPLHALYESSLDLRDKMHRAEDDPDAQDRIRSYAVDWGIARNTITLAEAERRWGKTNLRQNALDFPFRWQDGGDHGTWLTTTYAMKAAFGPVLYAPKGLPGCGKSTLAREAATQTGAVIVSPDEIGANLRRRFPQVFPANLIDWRGKHFRAIHRIAWRKARRLLQGGDHVVYDATNLTDHARQRLESLAQTTGATLVWREVKPPDEAEWKRRLAARPEGLEYWWAVVEKMRATGGHAN